MKHALFAASLLVLAGWNTGAEARSLTDAAGRVVMLPDTVERAICSGSGCLRLLTYLQALDVVVGVDDMEARTDRFDARPYSIANPQLRDMPVFGQFRGADNPELILALDPAPQVIFKIFSTSGPTPDDLSARTGLPVVAINYGDLGNRRADLDNALRLMGAALGREARAEDVIAYLDGLKADLRQRAQASDAAIPSVYLGGVAYRGPRGLQSTEPGYPPFALLGIPNPAAGLAGDGQPTTDVAKEMILAWDPDMLFLDLFTIQMGEGVGGLHELNTDPAYRLLGAVARGDVFGVLPYNLYAANFGSILANAYYIGTLVHPTTFADIDPAAKADEIYTFLVGAPVFEQMATSLDGLPFRRVPLTPVGQ